MHRLVPLGVLALLIAAGTVVATAGVVPLDGRTGAGLSADASPAASADASPAASAGTSPAASAEATTATPADASTATPAAAATAAPEDADHVPASEAHGTGPLTGLSTATASPSTAGRATESAAADSAGADATTSATTTADTDGDGLDDATERELGTDPTVADTDGDGLDDGAEVRHDALADADPLRMDVFVEVDSMEGYAPSDDAIGAVQAAFADSPVENPDGSTGISLHVRLDETIPAEATTNTSDRDRLMAAHFDHEGDGYHYAVAVANVRLDGNDYAGTAAVRHSHGAFAFQTTDAGETAYDRNVSAHVFMHELGHSLGIGPGAYDGVDSNSVPYDEYRSNMNYDAPWGTVDYSSSPPFDDWAYLAEELYTPNASRSG